MGVLVDLYAGASAHTSLANGSTFSFTNQSVNSNLQNSALLVCIVDDSALGTSFQCNWDTAGTNQLMTQIASYAVAGIGNLFFFGLDIPTPGTKTLGVKRTSGATSNCDVFSVSLYNADQVLANWSASSNTSTGTAASSATVSVGSRPGAYAFSMIGTITTLPSGPAGGTARFGPDTLTACVGMGADTTASTTSVIHTYTLSPSDSFVALMIDINPVTPWGFDSNTSIGGATALLEPRIRKRYAGTKGKSGFALLTTPLPSMDWANYPQPPQPNRPRRAAAVMLGELGTELPESNMAFNIGGFIQPWQPPHPAPEKRAAAIMPREDGIELPFINWKNAGWEIQPVQPPHPHPEQRAGAIMPRDDGMEAREIQVYNWGFEIQAYQPQHLRPERAGAIARSDEGDESIFIPPGFVTSKWGFEPALPLFSRHPTVAQRYPAIKGKSEYAIFPNFYPTGFEIQNVQPPHPRSEKAGSIMPKEDGIEAVYVPSLTPITSNWGFDPSLPLFAKHRTIPQGYPSAREDFIIFPKFFPSGFEIQNVQPPYPAPNKRATMPFLPGIDNIYSFISVGSINWGSYPELPMLRQFSTIRQRGAGAAGESAFAASSTGPVGWEIQSWQPPHPRPERFAATVKGIDGTEAKEIPFLGLWGFEIQSVQPPAFTRPRYGAIVPREDGIERPAVNFFPAGWEIPTFQPYNQMRLRAGKFAGGFNVEFQLPSTTFIFTGFEFDPFQVPHPRPAKAGSIMPSSSVEIPFQNWYNVGFEVQPVQPPHPRPEKAGGIMPIEPGIEAVFVFNPLNALSPWAFEAPPPQPPHPRQLHKGGIMPREDGIELPFVFVPIAPPTWGFEPWPPYKRVPYNVAGAIARGDEGIEATKINWFNAGWEIPPPQLHKYPERRGAIMRGDEGIQFIRIPPVVGSGWEIQPPPPPHQFRERRGAFLRGDEGIQSPKAIFISAGWTIQHTQPPHPRPERAGAIMPIEPGIEAVYVFVAPPVLANNFVQDQTIDLRSPMLAVARGAILLFDGLGLPFFPGPTPPPPFTGGGAAKVIGLDADFGGADVTRVFLSRVPSNLFVGDAIAVIIGVGGDLNLHSSYRMVFTKPDGTQFHIDSPNTYVGTVDAPTRQGTFAAQTYTICVLSGSTVDQHGTWTCFLEAPEFTSSSQQFYIGPPPMLQ